MVSSSQLRSRYTACQKLTLAATAYSLDRLLFRVLHISRHGVLSWLCLLEFVINKTWLGWQVWARISSKGLKIVTFWHSCGFIRGLEHNLWVVISQISAQRKVEVKVDVLSWNFYQNVLQTVQEFICTAGFNNVFKLLLKWRKILISERFLILYFCCEQTTILTGCSQFCKHGS